MSRAFLAALAAIFFCAFVYMSFMHFDANRKYVEAIDKCRAPVTYGVEA